MRLVLCFLLGLTACYSPQGTHCQRCSGISKCPDGLPCTSGYCREDIAECTNTDGGLDAPPGCFGITAAPFFPICPGGNPIPAGVDLFEATKTLVTPGFCTFMTRTPDNRMVCVRAAESIDFASNAHITIDGPLPLVLFATHSITISDGATLEVSARRGVAMSGTGHDFADCSTMNQGFSSTSSGGGGGAGGSFHGVGGSGGDGG
ncbi:MAG TPA: hypothetical protein VL856_15340, partial [Acidimicrobiia bacterium]|nr:hypothetical protein [Acidimicrobiia bacterium]